MSTCTITLTETAAPSRSKGRGWMRIDSVFATTTGRTIDAELGETVTATIGVELRRASGRVEHERSSKQLLVTGEPADTVTLQIGSPQPYAATISGVKEA